ncbi:MAG: dihydrolipoyl dehydrogenase [Trueperaceae bacterium]
MDYDLIVIGSGPGGYHAAIRAAQLGVRTAVVEKNAVGGVCLNVGCIPTKALLHVAHDLHEAEVAKAFGVSFGKPKLDLKRMGAWKGEVVAKMTGGVRMLMKGNKVDLIEGEAHFTGANELTVGDRTVSFEKAIVATGSSPIVIPGFEPDGDRVVDSTGALEVPKVPKRFLTIGGSAIGLEFADVYAALGSEVTVVELMDRIVPTADRDASKALHAALEKRGIRIVTSTKAVSQTKTRKGTEVVLEGSDGEQETLVVDKLLVAVGRKPNGTGLGLDAIGVEVDERGYVPVNDHLQTNVPHVYAIGDVARAPLLAHKAMKEGLVAAEHAAGRPAAYDTIVPAVIYTNPELASVGMTEDEARDAGYELRIGSFPLAASGRAATLGVDAGLVKLVGDASSDVLLGAHIVGPGAGDLIAETTLAIEMGATLEDVALTQHPHPTLSEGVMEAAEHAHGQAIHIANRRKR